MSRITGQQKGGSYLTKRTDLGIQAAVGRDKIDRLILEKELLERKEKSAMGVWGAIGSAIQIGSSFIPGIGKPIGALVGTGVKALGQGAADRKYDHESIKASDADTVFYAGQTAEYDKISAAIDKENDSKRKLGYLLEAGATLSAYGIGEGFKSMKGGNSGGIDSFATGDIDEYYNNQISGYFDVYR